MSADDKVTHELVGIWSWQVRSDLVIACAQVCEYVNVPVAQGLHGIASGRFLSAIHPDDIPKLARSIEAVFEGSEFVDVDYRVISEIHGTRWVRSSGRCFRDASGAPTHISGYLTNIEPVELPHDDVGSAEDLQNDLVVQLVQARAIANRLGAEMVGKMIDATLLEFGHFIAKVLKSGKQRP